MHHNPVQVDSWDSQRIDHHTWTNGIAHKLRGEWPVAGCLKGKDVFQNHKKKSVPGSVWDLYLNQFFNKWSWDLYLNQLFLTNLARLHQGGSAFFWSPTFEGPKNRGLPHRLSSSLWDGKFFKKCAEEKENTQPSNDFNLQEIGIYSQASACFQTAGNIPLLPVVIPPGYLARHVYGLQVRMFPACLGNLWQPNHKFPSIQDQNHFTSIVKNCQISWNSSGFHKIPSGICGCRFVRMCFSA